MVLIDLTQKVSGSKRRQKYLYLYLHKCNCQDLQSSSNQRISKISSGNKKNIRNKSNSSLLSWMVVILKWLNLTPKLVKLKALSWNRASTYCRLKEYVLFLSDVTLGAWVDPPILWNPVASAVDYSISRWYSLCILVELLFNGKMLFIFPV